MYCKDGSWVGCEYGSGGRYDIEVFGRSTSVSSYVKIGGVQINCKELESFVGI